MDSEALRRDILGGISKFIVTEGGRTGKHPRGRGGGEMTGLRGELGWDRFGIYPSIRLGEIGIRVKDDGSEATAAISTTRITKYFLFVASLLAPLEGSVGTDHVTQ